MDKYKSIYCLNEDHTSCKSTSCRCSCHNRGGVREPTKPKTPLDHLVLTAKP